MTELSAVPGDTAGATVNLAAVLFDMDGTLVDSERLWTVSMDRLVDRIGGTLSSDARAKMVGQSIPGSVRLMLEELGSDWTDHEATDLLLRTTAEIFAKDLMWQPGAQELIDAVRAAGLLTALVTNSPRVLVDVALGLLGDHRFDVTLCGDEVDLPKPDPQPYLRAMSALDLHAGRCLAVEDSPSGTESAVAAGIPVLVVPSEVPVPDGPGRIFANSLLDATVEELRHIHREFRRAAARP